MKELFERHDDNPIITVPDLPYRANAVFNAGAALVPSTGEGPVDSDRERVSTRYHFLKMKNTAAMISENPTR